MPSPSHYAMMMVFLRSQEVSNLNGLGITVVGEVSSLRNGDRVWLQTIDGDFAGTVLEEWSHETGRPVSVMLDGYGPVNFHRSVFKAWTALDHLVETQAGATDVD